MSDAAGDDQAVLDLIRQFGDDPWFAHRHLFKHRHPEVSSDAHERLVAAIHSPHARVSIEGFRGLGKTTMMEEAVILGAIYRRFHNFVIVGASLERAIDRIAAIKNELIVNPFIERLFGTQKAGGNLWQESKIVVAGGMCIQALGRDQSTLGIKYLDWRPDGFWIDDIEDPQERRSDAEREATWGWLMRTFLPALSDPLATWGRFTGTRRGTGSLPERLEKLRDPAPMIVKLPIEHTDEVGLRRATWPSKFPLKKVDEIRNLYAGDMHTYMQEFMCQAISEADRLFAPEMIRIEPRARTWQACYAMIDPARTVGQKSATTGWAVWSWLRNRLVVWGADGQMLLPDEIVNLAFEIGDKFDPVWIGVEEDGLNEWLLQPLRQEAARRGVWLPTRAMRAPRGKMQFIRGLQPFFNNREVEFAQPLPVLREQLLSYPTGRIDAPNALAYALLMRPGLPIYESFSDDNIVEMPEYRPDQPLYIVANATQAVTVAMLAQVADGRLIVLLDWLREGLPGENVAHIHNMAALYADSAREWKPGRSGPWTEMLKAAAPETIYLRQRAPSWVVPMHHGDRYNNVGLTQAIKQLPAEVRYGGSGTAGRASLADMLSRVVHGHVAVEVAPEAKWTLRALAGGYTRAMIKGKLTDYAEEGPYRLLMEGLESFLGIAARLAKSGDEEDTNANWAFDRNGRRYNSVMPARR